MDYSLPGSSVHGIFQARILEWVAISFSKLTLKNIKKKKKKKHLCAYLEAGITSWRIKGYMWEQAYCYYGLHHLPAPTPTTTKKCVCPSSCECVLT